MAISRHCVGTADTLRAPFSLRSLCRILSWADVQELKWSDKYSKQVADFVQNALQQIVFCKEVESLHQFHWERQRLRPISSFATTTYPQPLCFAFRCTVTWILLTQKSQYSQRRAKTNAFTFSLNRNIRNVIMLLFLLTVSMNKGGLFSIKVTKTSQKMLVVR